MFYVFHVDTGTMVTFDTGLALESVSVLQRQIEQTCKIPVEKQVLLASGGECLEPNARVCTYSAGTDTNPVFLFSTESTSQAAEALSSGSEIEMKDKVYETQDMPHTYQSVVARSQVAVQFFDLAKDEMKVCERLVLDQHLQMQGWSAVIANLDDITVDIRKRTEKFESNYVEYLGERDSFEKLVEHFEEDVALLEKVPLLPALLSATQITEIINESTEASTSENLDENLTKNQPNTLLEYISAADKENTIEHLYKYCKKGLAEYDDKHFESIKLEISKILNMINNPEMKEIKGIEDRLFGLDKLLCNARKYVQEQQDLAQSFQQNQARASNLGDTSILPDLCKSHKRQLLVMLKNHQDICDIRRRCTKAKSELSQNIIFRLQWIILVESNILELNQRLVIVNECLKRLRKQFDVLRQIHLAPSIYVASISEVVRRRAFSQAFLVWASDLACHLLTIYNEEVARRKEFQSQFEGHFLAALFPGMEDMPPSYATEAPSIFDSSLPMLTLEDVIQLKEKLPQLMEGFDIPNISAVTNFFISKSVTRSESDRVDESVAVEEKLVQVVTEVGLASNMDQNLLKPVENEPAVGTTPHGLPHLKDIDKGCESETDTEEFEKVGQSPLDLHFDKEIPSPRPTKQDASTSTAEVGERSPVPPKKPPRSFQKLQMHPEESQAMQRTLSVSSSNTDSFTNVKIDDSGLKNLSTNTDSCFNSHHQQMQSYASSHLLHSKSLSPHTPQSPREYLTSPVQSHQPNEFITDEYYIDESLPSSLSIETGQSQGEFVRQLDTANNVVALLQLEVASGDDNLETSRTEQDKLKSFLVKLAELSRQNISLLKTELSDIKNHLVNEKQDFKTKCDSLRSSWANLSTETANNHREILNRITVDHELEIDDIKNFQHTKDEEIKSLRTEIDYLETAVKLGKEEANILKNELDKVAQQHKEEIKGFEEQIEIVKSEKEKIAENLNREHKAEVEGIRSRFRLMVMERTPSDSSLEKIDISTESALIQMKENLEKQSKLEVEEAIANEKKIWEKKLEEMKAHYENMIEDVAKRISEEKEKQIDVLREREANLNLECIKYKSTIQQLAECESQSQVNELLEKVELLEKEKQLLQAELEKSKHFSSGSDLTTSIAVVEGKVDATTSPIKHKEKLTTSQSSLVKSGTINIDSCKVDDVVLVVWDQQRENYTIFQQSAYLYFLHTECLEPLGLKPTGNEPRKMYCIAKVTQKEFCHARKAENRFKVPKGTHFYRIKAKPLPSPKETPSSHASQPQQMSQSQLVDVAVQEVQSSTSYSVPVTPTKSQSVLPESVVQESKTPVGSLKTSQICESTSTSVVYESSLESLTSCADDTSKASGDVNR